MNVKPILQALLLCDEYCVDRDTNKPCIWGVFNTLSMRPIPGVRGRTTHIYLALTDIKGVAEVFFRWVELRTNRILMGTEPIRVESDDPLKTVELFAAIPGLPVQNAGPHGLEANCGYELLHTYRVLVAVGRNDEAHDDGGRQ